MSKGDGRKHRQIEQARTKGKAQNSLFYVDDGMVALSDLRWLQGAFITLVGILDRLGLKTNIWKTIRMV